MGEPRVESLVEHLFRHHAGRLVSTLTRIFGPEHLDLAEDVAQEALLAALRTWPFRGIPGDPQAWLTRVARNRALDALRRHERLRRHEADVLDSLDAGGAAPEGDALNDDVLAMMFTSCHPDIPHDARVALTLKTVGGFSTEEIARAFLTSPSTMAQRIVRAKRRLREGGIDFAVPEGSDLAARLDSVLEVVYLMFNEGYEAHAGDHLVRTDMAREALRLAGLLVRHERAAGPRTFALAALIALQAARLDARTDADGGLVLLEEQDRTLWDRGMIAVGFHYLERAAAGDELTPYHVQAAIAAAHVSAESWESTDWGAILAHYDTLVAMTPSPVVALNRAVAVAMVKGWRAGLDELDVLECDERLGGYPLLAATRGELQRRLGDEKRARACFEQALALTVSEPVRRFLERRLATL